MNPDTKEFLLHESDQMWKHLEHIWQTRNRTVALYFAALGAIAGHALSEAPKDCGLAGVGSFVLGQLLCLQTYFIATVVAFVAVVSTAASLLLIRFYTLTKEYVDTINYVRRAFRDADHLGLGPYLILPAEARVGRFWTVDLAMLLAVNALSGGVFAVGMAHALNSNNVAGWPWRMGPLLVFGLWLLFWVAWYWIARRGWLRTDSVGSARDCSGSRPGMA